MDHRQPALVALEAVAAKLGIDVDQVHSTAEARIKQAKARASDNGDRQATPA